MEYDVTIKFTVSSEDYDDIETPTAVSDLVREMIGGDADWPDDPKISVVEKMK